jgi:hypothetical protein
VKTVKTRAISLQKVRELGFGNNPVAFVVGRMMAYLQVGVLHVLDLAFREGCQCRHGHSDPPFDVSGPSRIPERVDLELAGAGGHADVAIGLAAARSVLSDRELGFGNNPVAFVVWRIMAYLRVGVVWQGLGA